MPCCVRSISGYCCALLCEVDLRVLLCLVVWGRPQGDVVPSCVRSTSGCCCALLVEVDLRVLLCLVVRGRPQGTVVPCCVRSTSGWDWGCLYYPPKSVKFSSKLYKLISDILTSEYGGKKITKKTCQLAHNYTISSKIAQKKCRLLPWWIIPLLHNDIITQIQTLVQYQ